MTDMNETIFDKIYEELDRLRREAWASVTEAEERDPKLIPFYKGKSVGLTTAMYLIGYIKNGELPHGVKQGLEYWQALTEPKRDVADFVAFCQERISVISDNFTEYGSSRGRAMIEAYQAAINYADSSPLLIDCLGDADMGELDAFMREGGEQ